MNYIALQTITETALLLINKMILQEGMNYPLDSITNQLEFILEKAKNNKNPLENLINKGFTYPILSSRYFASPEELNIKKYLDKISHILLNRKLK